MPENDANVYVPVIEKVKLLLTHSHAVLPKKAQLKLYHHNGINHIDSTGAAFISVIEHDYCKFIVAMIPGQAYPLHYHRIKDESFFILYGELTVKLEDDIYTLTKGDILNIPRRFIHSFSTRNGCVFEEISTVYLQNDSIYEDKIIQETPRNQRSTLFPPEILTKKD